MPGAWVNLHRTLQTIRWSNKNSTWFKKCTISSWKEAIQQFSIGYWGRQGEGKVYEKRHSCEEAVRSLDSYTYMGKYRRGFPGSSAGKQFACQCRRHKRLWFNSWVRKIPWRRWQPTLVVLLEHQRSLVGDSTWRHKESDTTGARMHTHTHAQRRPFWMTGKDLGQGQKHVLLIQATAPHPDLLSEALSHSEVWPEFRIARIRYGNWGSSRRQTF